MTESQELWLTRQQAAQAAGVHPATISKWKKNKGLKMTSDGRIALSELQRVSSELSTGPSTPPSQGPQLELMPEMSPNKQRPDRQAEEVARLELERNALLEERKTLRQELEDVRERERQWFNHQLKMAEERERVAQERERLLLQLLIGSQEPVSSSRPKTLVEKPRPQLAGAKEPEPPGPQPSLRDQVHDYLKTHPGPHTVKEIKDALELTKSPKDVLLTLKLKGEAERIAKGVYAARTKPHEPSSETFIGRILEYVRTATTEGRTVRAWQIQKDLELSAPPHRELSKLAQAQLVYRVKPSVYSATPPEQIESADAV